VTLVLLRLGCIYQKSTMLLTVHMLTVISVIEQVSKDAAATDYWAITTIGPICVSSVGTKYQAA
jgi:hypothetical protein